MAEAGVVPRKSFKQHFKRHVILKDFYFYTCCIGAYAGTRRAYIPMEYVMHTDLHGSRGATPPSPLRASVTVVAQFEVLRYAYEDDRWL